MKSLTGVCSLLINVLALALPVYADVALDAKNPEKARVHWQSQCHIGATMFLAFERRHDGRLS